MNAEQIKFQDSFKELLMALKEDITKEPYTQRTQFEALQSSVIFARSVNWY